MPGSRQFARTARLMAMWFVLAMAAAVVSPWVQPRVTVLVCNASGANRLLVQTPTGWSEQPSHDALHCPMCLLAGGGAVGADVSAGALDLAPVRLFQGRLRPWFHPLHQARAPLPARGPPVHS